MNEKIKIFSIVNYGYFLLLYANFVKIKNEIWNIGVEDNIVEVLGDIPDALPKDQIREKTVLIKQILVDYGDISHCGAHNNDRLARYMNLYFTYKVC